MLQIKLSQKSGQGSVRNALLLKTANPCQSSAARHRRFGQMTPGLSQNCHCQTLRALSDRVGCGQSGFIFNGFQCGFGHGL